MTLKTTTIIRARTHTHTKIWMHVCVNYTSTHVSTGSKYGIFRRHFGHHELFSVRANNSFRGVNRILLFTFPLDYILARPSLPHGLHLPHSVPGTSRPVCRVKHGSSFRECTTFSSA